MPVVNQVISSSLSFRPSAPLEPGVWFWRVFGRIGSEEAPVPDWTWEFVVRPGLSSATDTSFGFYPDYNGDGHIDLALPLSGYMLPDDTDVFYGTSTGLGSEPVRISRRFSQSQPAGDINGDGYCDLLWDSGENEQRIRRRSVALGGRSGLSADRQLYLAECGYGSMPLGDINSDSFGDVSCIGGIKLGATTSNQLAIYPVSFPNLHTIAGGGDINGDGFLDVISGGSIFLGSSTGLSPSIAATIDPPFFCINSSYTISGDGNGDGYSDISFACAQSSYGEIRVYQGGAIVRVSSSWLTWRPPAPIYGLGLGMAWVRDVTGDSYDDLAVGSGATTAAYLLSGSSQLSMNTTFQHSSDGFPYYLGTSFGGWGDADGDGIGDIFVAGNLGGGHPGRVLMYRGRQGRTETIPARIYTGQGLMPNLH